MKVCEGKRGIDGCGFPKDENEFYRTKGYLDTICIKCRVDRKRMLYQQRKENTNKLSLSDYTTMKWG